MNPVSFDQRLTSTIPRSLRLVASFNLIGLLAPISDICMATDLMPLYTRLQVLPMQFRQNSKQMIGIGSRYFKTLFGGANILVHGMIRFVVLCRYYGSASQRSTELFLYILSKKLLHCVFSFGSICNKGSPKGRKIHLFMKTFSKIDRSPQLLAFYLNKVYTKMPQ